MAEHEVTPLGKPIDFAPATERAEILQNVATILATPRFSVPYDRRFGIYPDYLDGPLPVAQARASADIIDAIHRLEPRCRVVSVSFTGDAADGTMAPRVRVSINE